MHAVFGHGDYHVKGNTQIRPNVSHVCAYASFCRIKSLALLPSYHKRLLGAEDGFPASPRMQRRTTQYTLADTYGQDAVACHSRRWRHAETSLVPPLNYSSPSLLDAIAKDHCNEPTLHQPQTSDMQGPHNGWCKHYDGTIRST